MERTKPVIHKGKTIHLVDLSNTDPLETIKVLPTARDMIGQCAPKSALVLTDVTNARYNKEVGDAIKDFVINNTPYIRASAIVGADGIRLVLLNTVVFLTRREIKTFDSREQAMDWLADFS